MRSLIPSAVTRNSDRNPYAVLGFTLVEGMVVVAIIGILSAVAISYAGGGAEDEMVREATQMAQIIEEARRQAITHSVYWRPYNAVFRFRSNSYQWCVYSCSINLGVAYPKGIVHNLDKIKVVKFVYYPEVEGAPQYSATTVNTSWRYLYFLRDGSVGRWSSYTFPSGATIYLQHKQDPTVKYKLVVMPISGKVMIYDHW